MAPYGAAAIVFHFLLAQQGDGVPPSTDGYNEEAFQAGEESFRKRSIEAYNDAHICRTVDFPSCPPESFQPGGQAVSTLGVSFALWIDLHMDFLKNQRDFITLEGYKHTLNQVLARNSASYKSLEIYLHADMPVSKFLRKVKLPLILAEIYLGKLVLHGTEQELNELNAVIASLHAAEAHLKADLKDEIDFRYIQTYVLQAAKLQYALAQAYFLRANLKQMRGEKGVMADLDLAQARINYITRFYSVRNEHLVQANFPPGYVLHLKTREWLAKRRFVNILSEFYQAIFPKQAALLSIKIQHARNNPQITHRSVEISSESTLKAGSKEVVNLLSIEQKIEYAALAFEAGTKSYHRVLLEEAKAKLEASLAQILAQKKWAYERMVVMSENQRKSYLQNLQIFEQQARVNLLKVKLALAEDNREEIRKIEGEADQFTLVDTEPEVQSGPLMKLYLPYAQAEWALLKADIGQQYFNIDLDQGKASIGAYRSVAGQLQGIISTYQSSNYQVSLRARLKLAKLTMAAASYFPPDKIKDGSTAYALIKSARDNYIAPAQAYISEVPLMVFELQDARVENHALLYFYAGKADQRDVHLAEFFNYIAGKTLTPRQELWKYKVISSLVPRLATDAIDEKIKNSALSYLGLDPPSLLNLSAVEKEKIIQEALVRRLNGHHGYLGGMIADDTYLHRDLLKIREDTKVQTAAAKVGLASSYYNLRDPENYVAQLSEAKKDLLAVVESKIGSAYTRGDACHWLAKIILLLIGNLKVGENYVLDAEGNSVKLVIENDHQLVQEQKSRLAEMFSCCDRAEPLLAGKAQKDLRLTQAEASFTLAYLNKDTGDYAEFLDRSEAALSLLAEAFHSSGSPDDPFAGSTASVYNAHLSLANFIAAIAGDKDAAVALQPKLQALGINLPFDDKTAETKIEHDLLKAAQKISQTAAEANFLFGRSKVAVLKTQKGMDLRLVNLFRDLVAKKEAPHGSARKDAEENLKIFAPDAGPDTLQKYITQYQQMLADAQKALREEVVPSAYKDVAEEGAVLLYQSIAATSSDIDDLGKQRDHLASNVVAPLEALLKKPDLFLKGRALVEAWKTLAESKKTVASITKDIEGYQREDKRRVCQKANDLFAEVQNIMGEKVLTSAREELKAEVKVILGDMLGIQAGDLLDPWDELSSIRAAKETIQEGLEAKYLDGKSPLLKGRIKIVAEKQHADLTFREGLAWRQIEGRGSKLAKSKFNAARAKYAALLASKRGEISMEAKFNLAFMRYVEAADKDQEVFGKKYDGSDQWVEFEILEKEAAPQIEEALASGLLTGRTKYNVLKTLGDTRARLGMIRREIYGKEDGDAKKLLDFALETIAKVKASGIKEFVDEAEISRIRILLLLAADSEVEEIELEKLAAAVASIEKVEDSPHITARAQMDLRLEKIEAHSRSAFLKLDLEPVDDRTVIKKLHALAEELEDHLEDFDALESERQRLAKEKGDVSRRMLQISKEQEEIKAKIKKEFVDKLEALQRILSNPASANHALAVALTELAAVLTSQRKDLKSIGDFWLGQILSVIASDQVPVLDLAERHLQLAYDSDELRGIQVIDAYLGIGKTLSRKAGIENESVFSVPGKVFFSLAPRALSHFQSALVKIGQKSGVAASALEEVVDSPEEFIALVRDGYQNNPRLKLPHLPREHQRKIAETYNEMAEILSWGQYRLELARDYYEQARQLLEDLEKKTYRDQKELARSYLGLGEMKRWKTLDIDYNQALEYYTRALKILESTSATEKSGRSFSAKTLRSRIMLGLANLYARQDWEQQDPEKSKTYFAQIDPALEDIRSHGIWTAEQDSVERMFIRSRQDFDSIYRPNATVTYSTKNQQGFPSQSLNLKSEIPLFEARCRVIPEMELKEVNGVKEAIPILSFACRSGTYETGEATLGLGSALSKLDFRLDGAYTYKNALALTASYHGLSVNNQYRQSIYASFMGRPFYAFPYLRDVPFLKGLSTGFDYVVYSEELVYLSGREDSGEYLISPARDTRLRHLVYSTSKYEVNTALDWLSASTYFRYPLAGGIADGALRPGESDTTLFYAPTILGYSLKLSPTWEILSRHFSLGFFQNFEFLQWDLRGVNTGGMLRIY